MAPDPKQFSDMSAAEIATWREDWRAGKAERWTARGVRSSAAGTRTLEWHAPTKDLCVQLVQSALKVPVTWVTDPPARVEPDLRVLRSELGTPLREDDVPHLHRVSGIPVESGRRRDRRSALDEDDRGE